MWPCLALPLLLFIYLFIYRIEDRKTLVHDQRRSLENRTSTDYCSADRFGRLWMWRHNDRCRRYTQCSRRSLHCPTTPVRNWSLEQHLTFLITLFYWIFYWKRYIYPVLDVDFVYGAVASSSSNYNEEAKPVLVTVFPFNSKGSLKDLIYRVKDK